MDIWHLIVLALIQGVTEFIPVSSSAHLVIIPKLLGWSDQSLGFDIALHLGTLMAVLFYFRSKLSELINPLNHLTKKLILATIPACLAGLIFAPYIENYLRSPLVIAAATIIFGLLLGFAQYRETSKIRDFNYISYKYSFLIGVAQCAALIPGSSRLGSTMTVALLLGLSRTVAAEFSFLMSIPIILLSSALLVKKIILDPSIINLALQDYLIGFVVSALVGTIVIHLLIKLIEKIGVMPFVIYRVLLGCFLFTIFI